MCPRRCVDRERRGVDDAVVGLDKFHPEASERHGGAERDDLSLGRLHHAPLFKFVLYDAHGEPCGEHRDIDLLKNIGQRAYVVLVPVGYDKALDLVDIVLKISGVRNDKIDSEHVVLRKRQSAVHNNNTVSILEGSDIHSDLLKPSERNDPERRLSLFLFCISLQVVSSYSSIRIPISSSLSLKRRSAAESSLSSSTTA